MIRNMTTHTRVYQCDRCSKKEVRTYEEPPPPQPIGPVPVPDGWVQVKVQELSLGKARVPTMDVCDSCADAIITFLQKDGDG